MVDEEGFKGGGGAGEGGVLTRCWGVPGRGAQARKAGASGFGADSPAHWRCALEQVMSPRRAVCFLLFNRGVVHGSDLMGSHEGFTNRLRAKGP